MIDDKYAPSGFVWKDPRNLTKEAIQDLLNHIRSRQEQYGPDEGFKFHSYLNGKEIVEAQYGTNAETHKAAVRNKKQQTSRKKIRDDIGKGKKKGKRSACPAVVPGVTVVVPGVTAIAPGGTVNVPCGTAIVSGGTAVDEIPSPYEPQIDPALLGNDGLTSIAQNTLTNDSQHHQESGGYIDDNGMQVLIANGFPNTIPVNGPQDGPPKYFVSAAAITFLSNYNEVHSTSNDIDSTNNNKSTNNKKTKNGRNSKSMEEVTVRKPRRSERRKENDKDQQRQTRSQKRADRGKKRS